MILIIKQNYDIVGKAESKQARSRQK